MWVCVCVCVCVCIYIYIYIYIYIHISVRVCIYICIVCTHTHTHTHSHPFFAENAGEHRARLQKLLLIFERWFRQACWQWALGERLAAARRLMQVLGMSLWHHAPFCPSIPSRIPLPHAHAPLLTPLLVCHKLSVLPFAPWESCMQGMFGHRRVANHHLLSRFCEASWVTTSPRLYVFTARDIHETFQLLMSTTFFHDFMVVVYSCKYGKPPE